MTTLFPYQLEGARFLAERQHAMLLDGMGLGKTPQAIVAADTVGSERTLVICPAIARQNWAREVAKFSGLNHAVQVIENGKAAIDPAKDVVVVSYDLAVRKRQALVDWAPQLVILDEAHALKNRTAKRTKAIYGKGGIARVGCRVWCLTGTPAPNNIGELWTHLRVFGATDLSFKAYLDKYCYTRKTEWGLQVVGNKPAAKELTEALDKIALRRKVEDVLHDLPPIRWSTQCVQVDSLPDELVALERSEETQACVSEAGLTGRFDDVALATLRRLTSTAKAPAVCELLASELEDDPEYKVIVFYHHRDVGNALQGGLKRFGVVRVDGNTLPAARQTAIDAFQAGEARVFLGQIQAASTAITLTAANNVVFAEWSWTPADNLQAAKRAHRIGQDRPVFVRMLALAGSLDEKILSVVERKMRNVQEVVR
jgi:SWI/SNF-related matrix-associated actin-dependent regulator 1 of chromatin subfamily A